MLGVAIVAQGAVLATVGGLGAYIAEADDNTGVFDGSGWLLTVAESADAGGGGLGDLVARAAAEHPGAGPGHRQLRPLPVRVLRLAGQPRQPRLRRHRHARDHPLLGASGHEAGHRRGRRVRGALHVRLWPLQVRRRRGRRIPAQLLRAVEGRQGDGAHAAGAVRGRPRASRHPGRTAPQPVRLQLAEPPMAYGRTYLSGLATLVPGDAGISTEGKIEYGTDWLYGLGRFDSGFEASNIYGLAGEMMLNFGPAGIPFVFALLGWSVRACERWAQRLHPDDARRPLVALLAVLCLLGVSSDLGNVGFAALKFGLLFVVALYLGSTRVRRGRRACGSARTGVRAHGQDLTPWVTSRAAGPGPSIGVAVEHRLVRTPDGGFWAASGFGHDYWACPRRAGPDHRDRPHHRRRCRPAGPRPGRRRARHRARPAAARLDLRLPGDAARMVGRLWRRWPDAPVVATVPGIVGSLVAVVASVRRTPFATKVVGDPIDVAFKAGVGGRMGRVAGVGLWARPGWRAAAAYTVAYVTSRYLQRRYPPGRRGHRGRVRRAARRHRPRRLVPPARSAACSRWGRSNSATSGSTCSSTPSPPSAPRGTTSTLDVVGGGSIPPGAGRPAGPRPRRRRVVPWPCRLRDEVERQLAEADVFALCSDTEGLPRALDRGPGRRRPVRRLSRRRGARAAAAGGAVRRRLHRRPGRVLRRVIDDDALRSRLSAAGLVRAADFAPRGDDPVDQGAAARCWSGPVAVPSTTLARVAAVGVVIPSRPAPVRRRGGRRRWPRRRRRRAGRAGRWWVDHFTADDPPSTPWAGTW